MTVPYSKTPDYDFTHNSYDKYSSNQFLNPPNIYSMPNMGQMKRSNVFMSQPQRASLKHSKSGETLHYNLNVGNNNKTVELFKSPFENNRTAQKPKTANNFSTENMLSPDFLAPRYPKNQEDNSNPKNNMYSSHILSSSNSNNRSAPKLGLDSLARVVTQINKPVQASLNTQNSYNEYLKPEFTTTKNNPESSSDSNKRYSGVSKQSFSTQTSSTDYLKNRSYQDYSKTNTDFNLRPYESRTNNIYQDFTKPFEYKSISPIKPYESQTYKPVTPEYNYKPVTSQYKSPQYKPLEPYKYEQNKVDYSYDKNNFSFSNPFRKDKATYEPVIPATNYENTYTDKKQYYLEMSKKTVERITNESKKNQNGSNTSIKTDKPLFAFTPPHSNDNNHIQIPTSPANFSKLKKPTNFNTMDFSNKAKFGQYTKKQSSEPKKLGKDDFAIGKKLGKGKFGDVFIVKNKNNGFICAMKIIPKKLIKEEKVELQLSRELKIQFFLNHHNITALYGYFDDQEFVYLLMELCSSGQLYDVLKEKKRLPESEASAVLNQICSGVQYMHRQRVIHRDLKPQNIIMQNGIAKICDFGWAVYRADSLRTTFCGTPLYVSPQILKGEKYDEKIDLWSIGILCYELLIGRIPFKINSESDLSRIINDQIKFPEYIPVSDVAKDFILKILKKNPEDRIEIEELMNHQFMKNSIAVVSDIDTNGLL